MGTLINLLMILVVPENMVPDEGCSLSLLSKSPSLFSDLENPKEPHKDDDMVPNLAQNEYSLFPMGSRSAEETVGLLGSLLDPEDEESIYFSKFLQPLAGIQGEEASIIQPLLLQSASPGTGEFWKGFCI